MPRGPRPTPTVLKHLDANAGRRPLSTLAVPTVVGSVLPEPPERLGPAAAAEWRRVTADMAAMKLLSDVHRPALELYCTLYERWCEIEDMLAETRDERGRTRLLFKQGKAVSINPLQYESRALAKQLMNHLAEFGLTPSSASRVHPDRWNDPANKLLNYIRSKPRPAIG